MNTIIDTSIGKIASRPNVVSCWGQGCYLAWWRHEMETFSALLSLCAGNSLFTGEFPSQRPVTRSFDVYFDMHLNKRLSKLRDAGDLRHHRAHYHVTVMNKAYAKMILQLIQVLSRYEPLWTVAIGSGNGFLPDGIKPLPEPTLTRYCWCLYQCSLTVTSMQLTYLLSAIPFAHFVGTKYVVPSRGKHKYIILQLSCHDICKYVTWLEWIEW